MCPEEGWRGPALCCSEGAPSDQMVTVALSHPGEESLVGCLPYKQVSSREMTELGGERHLVSWSRQKLLGKDRVYPSLNTCRHGPVAPGTGGGQICSPAWQQNVGHCQKLLHTLVATSGTQGGVACGKWARTWSGLEGGRVVGT